jgi:hypothetical protein
VNKQKTRNVRLKEIEKKENMDFASTARNIKSDSIFHGMLFVASLKRERRFRLKGEKKKVPNNNFNLTLLLSHFLQSLRS